jgi:hypothetical protein
MSLRSVVRSGIARIRWAGRIRSQVRRPRINRPHVPLRIGLKRLGRGSTALRRSVRPGLRLRIGPRLKLRMRLILRRTRLVLLRARLWLTLRLSLMLRLRMGLRSRARSRRRRRPLRLAVLSENLHRRHEQGSQRGSQCRAAPRLRPAYAFHIHPDSVVLSPELLPQNTGLRSSWCSNRHRSDPPTRRCFPTDPAIAHCYPGSAGRPPPRREVPAAPLAPNL